MTNVTITEAQDLKRELEIKIMAQIRTFEGLTGLRITKADMRDYSGTRFFTMSAYMPPKTRRDED